MVCIFYLRIYIGIKPMELGLSDSL